MESRWEMRIGGNSVSNIVMDIGNSEEVEFTTSGGLGEAETAGATINVIPRYRRQQLQRIASSPTARTARCRAAISRRRCRPPV